MKLLEKEEKIAFMKVLYTFVMRDNRFSSKENTLLDSFKNIVFKLNEEGIEDYEWMVNLGSKSNVIAKEINKIKDSDTQKRLILILIEIALQSEKTKGFIFKKIEDNELNFIKEIISLTSLNDKDKEGLYNFLKEI